MSNNKNIFIFDFDGVIIDSFESCLSVTKMYDPQITDKLYRQMFTGNIYRSLEKRNHTIDPNFNFFYHYFEKIIKIPPIKGIREVLKLCRNSGQVFIVSSTDTEPIKNYLQKNNLSQFIDRILGGDVERSKTKKLKGLIENSNTQRVYFITDTVGDVIEASQLNIVTIAVTWGFHDRSFFSKVTSNIVDSVEELKHSLNLKIL